MKIEFSQEKIGKIGKAILRILPQTLVVIFIVIFSFLAYITIWPSEDQVAKADGDKKVNSLKINFNQKTYADLNKDAALGVTAGNRNPFSN